MSWATIIYIMFCLVWDDCAKMTLNAWNLGWRYNPVANYMDVWLGFSLTQTRRTASPPAHQSQGVTPHLGQTVLKIPNPLTHCWKEWTLKAAPSPAFLQSLCRTRSQGTTATLLACQLILEMLLVWHPWNRWHCPQQEMQLLQMSLESLKKSSNLPWNADQKSNWQTKVLRTGLMKCSQAQTLNHSQDARSKVPNWGKRKENLKPWTKEERVDRD